MSDLYFDITPIDAMPQTARVVVEGAIDATSVIAFEDKLKQLQQDGFSYFVLDMAGIKYVNSTGLGSLVSTADNLEKVGGGLALIKVHPKVKVVFDMLGLNSFFKIFTSETEAIEYLRNRGTEESQGEVDAFADPPAPPAPPTAAQPPAPPAAPGGFPAQPQQQAPYQQQPQQQQQPAGYDQMGAPQQAPPQQMPPQQPPAQPGFPPQPQQQPPAPGYPQQHPGYPQQQPGYPQQPQPDPSYGPQSQPYPQVQQQSSVQQQVSPQETHYGTSATNYGGPPPGFIPPTPQNPQVVACPSCGATFKVSATGKYKCPSCTTTFVVDPIYGVEFAPSTSQLTLSFTPECREGITLFLNAMVRRAGYSDGEFHQVKAAMDEVLEALLQRVYGNRIYSSFVVAFLPARRNLQIKIIASGGILQGDPRAHFPQSCTVFSNVEIKPHPRGGTVVSLIYRR